MLDTTSGAAHALGRCGSGDGFVLSPDGTTAFSAELGGWVDATSGAVLDPIDRTMLVGPATRSWVATSISPDLSTMLVLCVAGADPKSERAWLKRPRRAFVLDRATHQFAPVAGPTSPLGIPSMFVADFARATTAGDELFWDEGAKVFRASTTPTGPAGPLPADCRPA